MFRPFTYINRIFMLTLLSLLVACSCSCGEDSAPNKQTPTTGVIKRDPNVITFVTINSPSTYYINSDREFAGLEYDLAKAFSKFLGNHKQIEFIVVDSIQEVVEALVSNKADIAAADLTMTESRKALIDFSIPYQSIQQQVIYNREITKKPARNVSRLVGKEIVVPASSSFVERLKALQQKHKELKWLELDAIHSENILDDVAEGEIEYTIADDHLVSMIQNFHPNLRVAFPFGQSEKIAWGFRKGYKPNLL